MKGSIRDLFISGGYTESYFPYEADEVHYLWPPIMNKRSEIHLTFLRLSEESQMNFFDVLNKNVSLDKDSL